MTMERDRAEERLDDLPLIPDGPLDQIRMPLEDLANSEAMPRFRFPNGVAARITRNAKEYKFFLNDPRFHSKRFVGEPQLTPTTVIVPEMPGFIPGMNGTEHLKVRRLVSGVFSVKGVDRLRGQIVDVVDAQLDVLEGLAKPFDLFTNYTLPIPAGVISRMLGVAAHHTPDFQLAARNTIGGLSTEVDSADAPARAIQRLHDIIGEAIEMKRAEPDDTIIATLVQSTDPALSDEEIKGLCTNLVLAGYETTAGSSIRHISLLLEKPDLRAQFLESTDEGANAIEEMTRWSGIMNDSGSTAPRVAVEDVEYEGTVIHAGEWVMGSPGLANIDPDVTPEDPYRLDLKRNAARHLSFGYGPHTCLGQHLARAEMKAIIWRLFERFPDIRIADGHTGVRRKGFGLDRTLIVTW